MLTKSRLIQLLIMLILLIGLFVWRTVEQSVNSSVTGLVIKTNDENMCDFSSPCQFYSALGTFYLSVDEGEIVPEEWFHLTLSSDVTHWQVSEAKLIGKSMFMGKIPIKFSPISPSQLTQKMTGTAKTMVGSCTEDSMVWRFDIVINIDGQNTQLYYDFIMYR
jgi:hypothetical protein